MSYRGLLGGEGELWSLLIAIRVPSSGTLENCTFEIELNCPSVSHLNLDDDPLKFLSLVSFSLPSNFLLGLVSFRLALQAEV